LKLIRRSEQRRTASRNKEEMEGLYRKVRNTVEGVRSGKEKVWRQGINKKV